MIFYVRQQITEFGSIMNIALVIRLINMRKDLFYEIPSAFAIGAGGFTELPVPSIFLAHRKRQV